MAQRHPSLLKLAAGAQVLGKRAGVRSTLCRSCGWPAEFAVHMMTMKADTARAGLVAMCRTRPHVHYFRFSPDQSSPYECCRSRAASRACGGCQIEDGQVGDVVCCAVVTASASSLQSVEIRAAVHLSHQAWAESADRPERAADSASNLRPRETGVTVRAVYR